MACLCPLFIAMSHMQLNKLQCPYVFLCTVACDKDLCRMYISRKGRVAVSNLQVEGQSLLLCLNLNIKKKFTGYFIPRLLTPFRHHPEFQAPIHVPLSIHDPLHPGHFLLPRPVGTSSLKYK